MTTQRMTKKMRSLLDLASDCDGLYVEGTDQWAARVLARRGLVEITEETQDGWIGLRITLLGREALAGT